MDYEKAYREALERAKKWYYAPNANKIPTYANRVIKEIFPELKESDDKRIRKAILIYLDWLDGRKDYAPRGEYSIRDMTAWLEKQGEKPQGKTALEAIKEEKEKSKFGQYKEEGDIIVTADDGILRTFKRIEPKFKIGDYVVTDYIVGKIFAITDDSYLLDTGQGIPFSSNNVHLWTIQDAKDGDVLTVNGRPFIYCCNDDYQGNYCCIGPDGVFRTNLDFGFNGKTILPATKEQRDLLFQKMKESGYEWDTEKKELKKIKEITEE